MKIFMEHTKYFRMEIFNIFRWRKSWVIDPVSYIVRFFTKTLYQVSCNIDNYTLKSTVYPSFYTHDPSKNSSNLV